MGWGGDIHVSLPTLLSESLKPKLPVKQSIGCLYLKQNGLFKDKFNMQCEVSSYSPLFSIRLAYNQAGGRGGMGGGGRDEREGMREKG